MKAPNFSDENIWKKHLSEISLNLLLNGMDKNIYWYSNFPLKTTLKLLMLFEMLSEFIISNRGVKQLFQCE